VPRKGLPLDDEDSKLYEQERRMNFTYEALPGRVVSAAGALGRVGSEVERLGGSRVFLIVDQAAKAYGDAIAGQLGDRLAARWNEAIQHVPTELAERALAAALAVKADCLVCVGGGSATGLAKIIALDTQLPIVAVPTTYAGSEMTPIYGSTGDRHKRVGKHLDVLPKTVIYDPILTLTLPPKVTGPSAFNAIAHSVEALWMPQANPITSALAIEGVRAIAASLARVMAAPDDIDARGELQYGACLAGMSLAQTGTGLHHKLCHVLGGTFNLIHADTHSVILPHALAFNAAAIPGELPRLAAALGVAANDAPGGVWDLAKASGVPTSLAELGLKQGDLDEAADRAASEITANPLPVNRANLRQLLQAAFDGIRPS
jgi:maleylacetate reductase